jgi:hypothetical protein
MSKLLGPVPTFTGNESRSSNDRQYISRAGKTKAVLQRPKQAKTRIPHPKHRATEDIPLKDMQPQADHFKPGNARPVKPNLKHGPTNELFSFPQVPGWRDYSPAMVSLDKVQKQQTKQATINHLNQLSSQTSNRWSLSKAFQAPLHWLRSLLSR